MQKDANFMRRALALAEQGRYSVSPNPMVGCVLVRDGAVIGEGWHRQAGLAHAEIEALASCADPRGATVYVTLEPCSHYGRTAPCAEALVEARVSRVVVAAGDPNPLVNGTGLAILREAGIEVTSGVLEAEAARQNEKFFFAIRNRRAFALLKAAMTFDGKLATEVRESRWITSEASRQRSLELREEYDAILVGSGTVIADDPQLTRRLGRNGSITPWLRVVVDSGGKMPATAKVLSDGQPTMLFTSRPDVYRPNDGLVVVALAAKDGRISLERVLQELFDREIHSVLVEGGAAVHADFIARKLWQKMAVFVAPMVVGGREAPSIFGGDPVARLTEAHRFRFDAVEQVGTDILVTAYPL